MSFEKLGTFVRYLRKLQEADLDALLPVTGHKGTGKSSFCIQVSKRYVEKYGRVCKDCGVKHFIRGADYRCEKCGSSRFGSLAFNVEDYIAYDNQDLIEKIHKLPAFAPLIADEAARFAMGEDWNKYESKQLKKLFAQIRTKHLIIFFNLPRFRWLDKKYREDMSTLWVRLISRGMAVVFQPNLGEVSDPYHLKELEKCLGNYNYFTRPEDIQQKLYKHPCYWDSFMFPPVEARLYEKYLIIRDKKVFERKDVTFNQKDLAKLCVYNLIAGWERFMGAVEVSRFKKPTFELIRKFIFLNPKKDEPVISSTGTLHDWYKSMERHMEKK